MEFETHSVTKISLIIIMVIEYLLKKFSNSKTPIVLEIAEYNRINYRYNKDNTL